MLYETAYDEVPLTMTAAKYATFCAPFEVNVPYGMKAYTVNGTSQDNLTLGLTEVQGTIPANTPVVLEGDEAVALTAYGVADYATAEAGWLTGVYQDTPAPVGSYVLQKHDDMVGFYRVEDVVPNVPAFRAYMQVPNSEARAFFFGGNATGIISIDNGKWIMDNGAEANSSLFTLHSSLSSWYDLSGRKVNGQCSMFNVQRSTLKKGVYIINGKKVVVK